MNKAITTVSSLKKHSSFASSLNALSAIVGAKFLHVIMSGKNVKFLNAASVPTLDFSQAGTTAKT